MESEEKIRFYLAIDTKNIFEGDQSEDILGFYWRGEVFWGGGF
jgi:hypothetical protein